MASPSSPIYLPGQNAVASSAVVCPDHTCPAPPARTFLACQGLVTTLGFHGATARPEMGDRRRWAQGTPCGRSQLWMHVLDSGLALLWDSCPYVCLQELVS